MKAWASPFLFVFFPLTLVAKERNSLTYDDLSQLIRQNSKDVKAAELLIEASSARQGYQARAHYPELGLESGLRGVRERDGSGDSAPFFKLEGTVNLYRGNRDAMKDVLQEKETAIRKEEAQLARTNQLSLARELFVKLASVQELEKAWVEAMKLAAEQKKSSRVKVNAGLTTTTDLLEFELYEASLRREKRNLEKEKHELASQLRILLGWPESAEITMNKPFAPPTKPLEKNYPLTADAHPSVRKLSLQSDQAQTLAQSAVSRWSPEIDAFASYEEYLIGADDSPGALPRRDLAAGIRLSVPLGANANTQNEAAARRLEASAYDLQKQQSAKQIEALYHARLHDMNVLYELIQDAEVQLVQAKKYLKQTRDEYERGIKNGPDVLEASRMLYATQVESIQLVFEYHLAEVGLRAVTEP